MLHKEKFFCAGGIDIKVKNKKLKILLSLITIFIIFGLLNSISAADISDTNLDQINDDNTITAIGEMNDNENGLEEDDANGLDEGDENQIDGGNSIYVSNAGSDEGDGTISNPYNTVSQGIENSANETTIYISSGTYDTLNITINKTLTIIGNSTILDGKGNSRLFLMNSDADLTLIGLTLLNGWADDYNEETGGTIYNNGGKITLINSTIKNSFAYNGGAIYNNLGSLNIINSNFTNNSAVQYGGVLYTLGQTTIDKSSFIENFLTGDGGVGACIACGGTATITNTEFIKNYSPYSAGAILNLADTIIDNCSFINQSTDYTAGAISNHYHLIVNNSIFSRGYAQYYAAAILGPPSNQHVKTEVYNTIFEKNYVTYSGAISNNFKDAELIIENCAIIGNYILKDGKKIYGDVSLDDTASMLYCWWGQNEVGNYYSPYSSLQEPWRIDASKWLIMTFTTENGIIEQEKNNLLTVSLHQYFDNETKETYEYNEDINLPLTVRFYTSTGKTIANVMLVNGTATLNYIPELNVRVLFAELNSQTLNISVKLKNESKLSVNDFTKYYKQKKTLDIKLTDANNAPLINKTVTISISGKNYKKTTDSNGIAKLDIGLSPGTYNAKISFVDDDYRNQNMTIKVKILKNKTSVSAKNLVKYYKNGTKLSVKLLDNNKKAMASKKVKLTIAGKTYYKTTNSKGIATFAINNKVGTYNAKISYAGNKIYASSAKTVKAYVKSAKIALKKTRIRRNSNLVVTFKDKNGKLIKNTKVKFQLNGKTYTRTTNKKGQAKLKVKVKIGSYKLKTSFKSTNVYGATVFTNKIKVVR